MTFHLLAPTVITAYAPVRRPRVVPDDNLEAFNQFDAVDVDIHMQQRLPNYHRSFNVRMDGSKNIPRTSGAGDPKMEGKTGKSLWRPESTQASSSEDTSVKDGTVERKHVLSHANHSISVEVGRSLFPFIEGEGGSTQERIEKEMRVKIRFPRWKDESNESITIEGSSAHSITKAAEKIQSIINEAVNSPKVDYSHFVSLPLAMHPELARKLYAFQNNILGIAEGVAQQADKSSRGKIPLVNYPPKASTSSGLSDLGIEKSIFINPRTFHLTVLMLKLWNKDRVNTAAKVLKNVSSKVMDALNNRPVSIKLTGLACMRGSFDKAYVLYAPVEEVGNRGRLMHACQVIIEAFVEAGLVVEKDVNHELKLHATVMNVRHNKRTSALKHMKWFNARGIYERYGSEEWGEYPIPEAHLSERFGYDDSGYYHCCASIPFP